MNNRVIDVTIKGSDYTKVIESLIQIKENGKVIYNYEDGIDQWNDLLVEILCDENEKHIDKDDFIINVFNSISKKEIENIMYDEEDTINNVDDNEEDYKLYFGSGKSMMIGARVGVIKFKRWHSYLFPRKNNKLENDIVFNIIVQIQSRFDIKYEDGMRLLTKPYFLSTMLLRNHDGKEYKNEIPYDEESIYDFLLVFVFKQRFSYAVQKGLFRTYRRFERNDDRLRGTIDVSRHIKLNAGRNNGKIAYSYRENTVDNYMNCLIVKAYEILKRKHYDLVYDEFDSSIDLKGTLDFIKNQLSSTELNDMYLIAKNTRSIAHPFYNEYESLRKICIWILRDDGVTFFDGSEDDDIRGMLFYIPRLWEKYLEDEMKEKLKLDNIKFETQYESYEFGILGKDGYDYKLLALPDFMFYISDDSDSKKYKNKFMILDAKFKPKWRGAIGSWKTENDNKQNGKSDVKEDIDKCIRDMVVNDCIATGVIFPMNYKKRVEQDDDDENSNNYSFSYDNNKIVHPISKDCEEKIFYTFPIIVPYITDENENDYNKWIKGFDNNLNEGIKKIGEILEKESKVYRYIKVYNDSFKEYIMKTRFILDGNDADREDKLNKEIEDYKKRINMA